MNWMTSGRHRAVRSKRGKKRTEMHFPAHVQRELLRVRRPPPTTTSITTKETNTAWYMRSIHDENESHDIQMLELAREVAMGRPETSRASSPTPTKTTATKNESNEENTAPPRRCVFTPVKESRARPRRHTEQLVTNTSSPQASDLLLFDEGEQVTKKSRAMTASNWAGDSSLPQKQSAATSSRWSATEDVECNFQKPTRRESQNDTPFYACSSSSLEEDFGSPDIPILKRTTSIDHEPDQACNKRPIFGKLFQASQGEPTMAIAPVNFPQLPFPSSENPRLQRTSDQTTHHAVAPIPCSFPATLSATREAPVMRERLPMSNLPFASAKQSAKMDSGQEFVVDYTSAFRQSQRETWCMVGTIHDTSTHPEVDLYDTAKDHSLAGQHGIMDETRDSTSSQGSLVLPPPVDWLKGMLARHKQPTYTGTDATRGLKIKQSEPFHTSQHDRTQVMDASIAKGDCNPLRPIHINEKDGTWRSSSRTQAILSLVCDSRTSDIQQLSTETEISELHKELREKEEIIIYVHTLLQCFRIDEEFKVHQ